MAILHIIVVNLNCSFHLPSLSLSLSPFLPTSIATLYTHITHIIEPISERVLFINGEVIISDTPQSGPEIESEPEIEAGPLLSSTPAEVEQSTKSKVCRNIRSVQYIL